MANPVDYEARSADLTTVTLHLVIPIGAAGAVGTATSSHEFLVSGPLVHGGTGVYTVHFRETWYNLLGYSLQCQQASYSASGADHVTLVTNSVRTAGTIVVTALTAAGAPVDPASGDILFLTFDLQETKP